MAGSLSDESGVGRSSEGISSAQQRCQAGEALAEWRSSEQVENGIPSTSPSYWDTDDDDDCGPKPAGLFGKHTWKIDNFSQINKRELRSNLFEIGGYKWYMDFCWSHFAQFTIAVVNKDPKKSKHSDTLHRFWKKEHDWGWKKFMELSKVLDGFIDGDALTIKAQVQVIRERVDRPFRCLDCQYRRELVRVYLSNVEQTCRRPVEEIRVKIGSLIDDAPRWSSGLKALEGQIKNNKARGKYLDAEELSMPIVLVDKDTFVLVDDVLLLLERAAVETLPPKDEKGLQNRTKDGSYGEDFTRDSFEHDERRLTEIGRRTIEIIVLDHIFSSKIEIAYQEAVALKRQEELIREEEAAAWLAAGSSDQKAKRDKEKKSKKKQGKQKRNNRKGKDKGREAKPAVEEKRWQESCIDERKDFFSEVAEVVLENPDTIDDVSDMSDSVDCATEDRESSPINWDTDTSEVHRPPTEANSSGINSLSSVQNGGERKSPSLRDDSSSTCSTESILSVVTNGSYKGNSLPNKKTQKSPSREGSQGGRATCDVTRSTNDTHGQTSECLSDVGQGNDVSEDCQVVKSESDAVVLSLQDRIKWLEQHVVKKEEEVVSLQRKLTVKDEVYTGRPPKKYTTEVPSAPVNPPNNVSPVAHLKPDSKISGSTNPIMIKKPSADSTQRTTKLAETAVPSRPSARNAPTPKPTEKPRTQLAPVPVEKHTTPQVPATSRPSSASLTPMARPITPVVSLVQTAPLLSHSASAASQLGPDPAPAIHSYGPQNASTVGQSGPDLSPATPSYSPQNVSATGRSGPDLSPAANSYSPQNMSAAGRSCPDLSPATHTNGGPQSYRNAMMGNTVNSPPSYSQPPALISASISLPPSSERTDPNAVRPSPSFGMVNNNIQNFDLYRHGRNKSRDHFPAGPSERQSVMADDFPHLDIINELLDDEFQNFNNGPGPPQLNRQLTFPDLCPSTSSSRFERTQSYNDNEFQHGYRRANNIRAYANGQIDGLVPNQWQMNGCDASYLSLRNGEDDGYPYHIPEYSNLPYGINGYTVYRPSNGH
ncbi:hypothetical protein LguiA_001237 [Lonicera macranthoides]